MAQFYDQPAKNYSFLNASIKAITSPSQATFRSLAQDPGATAGKAFLWVAIASAVSALIGIVMFQIFPQNWWMQYLSQYSEGYLDVPARTDIAGVLITLVCGIPVGVVLAVIGFAILSGLLHLVARMLGGSGDYGKLAYMLALVSVPFTLLNSVLAPIPFVGCLSFLITIYLFVLQVLSIEAVHQFGIAKAVVTLIIPLVVLCLLVICIVVGLGSFIFIAAQEAFENIPQEFPMP